MRFVLGRTGAALVTLFLVSVFCFLAFSVIRGDPAVTALGINASPQQLETYRREMGLDQKLSVRYFSWLGNFVSGNPGSSVRFRGAEISSLVTERLPVSCTLASLSMILILFLAIPVSLLTVRRENGIIARTVNILTAAAVGIPNFFLGILLIWIFGIGLRLFTPEVYIDYRENFFGFVRCLFFPALAIAIPNAAILVKFLRTSLFAEMRSDYVRTAYGKGAGHSIALRRHALRNALIPSITVFAMIMAEIFSGSIVIEQVFAIPGIGRLLITAIASRDYPLIQALVMYIALVVITVNTLADIAIQLLDPRIRLERNREA